MTIRLVHGDEQRFRFRCPDITIRGQLEGMKMPIVAAGVTLKWRHQPSFVCGTGPRCWG